MKFANNITKRKTAKINSIKDQAFMGEVELGRTLALKASLKAKLALFEDLRNRAEAHAEADLGILLEIQALDRYLCGVGAEAASLTRSSSDAYSTLLELLRDLQNVSDQLCIISQMLISLQDVVEEGKAKIPRISKDLLNGMGRAVKAANESLAASIKALDDCIPSLRDAKDARSSWKGSEELLEKLSEKVVGSQAPFQHRISQARQASKAVSAQAQSSYERVNAQYLAVQTQASIDQAHQGAILAALKAAKSAVASSKF